MYADKDYIISLRREIHEWPEVEFDLPRTVALVKRELDAIGVEYTEAYGESSVVAMIGPKTSAFTLAIRADMDALPVEETTDLPFRSRRSGFMHACGHDAHTAMLLGTAKALKGMEDKLACRVKLLFQPSEEGMNSGAMKMVEDGVMDDVDVVIGLHIENWLPVGSIGVCKGVSMASSRFFKVEMFGKSAHATLPHSGKDALAAAVKAYNNIQYIVSREVNPLENCVVSIGTLQSGTAHNVIADYAVMTGTIRTYSLELDGLLIRRIEETAKAAAADVGVTAKVSGNLHAAVVYNDPEISDRVLDSARKIVGAENVKHMPVKISSEDFSWYLQKKPGVFFRLGTRNEGKGIITLPHNNDFMIDEDALPIGTDVCVQFVLDHMNGLEAKE